MPVPYRGFMCLSLLLQKCFTSCLDSATFSCSFQMMMSIVCDARCYTCTYHIQPFPFLSKSDTEVSVDRH